MSSTSSATFKTGSNLLQNVFDAFDDWMYEKRKLSDMFTQLQRSASYKKCMQEEATYTPNVAGDENKTDEDAEGGGAGPAPGDDEDDVEIEELEDDTPAVTVGAGGAESSAKKAKDRAANEMKTLKNIAEKNAEIEHVLQRNAVKAGETIPLSGFLVKPGKPGAEEEDAAVDSGETKSADDEEVDSAEAEATQSLQDKEEQDEDTEAAVPCAEFNVGIELREQVQDVNQNFARFRDLLDKSIPHLERLIQTRAVTENFF